MKKLLILSLFLLAASPAMAVGPGAMAKSDRSLWPEALDSKAAYDRASRAEILVFSQALAEVSGLDEAGLKDQLHIKNADTHSVAKVSRYLTEKLLGNFKIASASCTENEPFCPKADSASALLAAGKNLNLPEKYRAWYANAQAFHLTYARELVRLAALFPKITSEIDTFNSNERNGFELPDGHFLLSFDDGPTAKGGHTDALLSLLAEHDIHAMFYMLGDRLQERAAMQDAATLRHTYAGQCAALHGWHHNSHQKWDKWESSITDTEKLVQETFGALYRPFFRPPYAQRRSDSETFFKANQLSVGLWNIDTQDWSNKVSGPEAGNRALTLMLLWRRGVFLFHDIHPKALAAIPYLLDQTKKAGIVWDDCRTY